MNTLSGWPEAERVFLEQFYREKGAVTLGQKLTALESHLGGQFAISSAGGLVTLSQKVACLEYELLFANGLCQGVPRH